MIAPANAALRIGLAVIAGAVIGIEREWRHKNAGIKTNVLVSIGSAVFALLSDTFPHNNNPAQLAAAVVGGIGFIGAGVIIHRGASVQGVTTAATLWANASMGVALGLGFLEVAGIAFIGIVVVQFGMRVVVDAVARRAPRERQVELLVDCSEAAAAAVTEAWDQFASAVEASPIRRVVSRTNGRVLWRAVFITPPRAYELLARLETTLTAMSGVTRIEVRQMSAADERP